MNASLASLPLPLRSSSRARLSHFSPMEFHAAAHGSGSIEPSLASASSASDLSAWMNGARLPTRLRMSSLISSIVRGANMSFLLLFLTPKLIEKTALVHLDEITAVDHIGRLDRLCARIERRDLIERGLERGFLYLESPLERRDLGVVGGVEDLRIRDAHVLAEHFVNEIPVAVEDLRGLGHRAHEAADHRTALGDKSPQRHERRGAVRDAEL